MEALGPGRSELALTPPPEKVPWRLCLQKTHGSEKMQPTLKDDTLVESSGSRCRGRVWSAGRLRGNNAIKGKGRRKQDFAGKVSDQDTDLHPWKGRAVRAGLGSRTRTYCGSVRVWSNQGILEQIIPIGVVLCWAEMPRPYDPTCPLTGWGCPRTVWT